MTLGCHLLDLALDLSVAAQPGVSLAIKEKPAQKIKEKKKASGHERKRNANPEWGGDIKGNVVPCEEGMLDL